MDAGNTRDVALAFGAMTPGSITVVATLADSESTAYLTVRSPDLSSSTWNYQDLTCTDSVPFSVDVKNVGTGIARSARVDVQIFNENNVAQDQGSAPAGSVSPGQTQRVGFNLFARDSCGRDDYYHVTVTITPQYGQAVQWTTRPFSI
jgi:hypothetical protein